MYKMSTETQRLTYYQKNRDAILARTKKYFEKNEEKRKEYQRNRDSNVTKEEKAKLNEYRKAWHQKLDLEKKNKLRKHYMLKYRVVGRTGPLPTTHLDPLTALLVLDKTSKFYNKLL